MGAASWVLGASINIAGSIMINLGTNIMKLGHNLRAEIKGPDKEKPSITKFKTWRIGVTMFIVGNLANFLSFGFAAQSLLAALGTVQFVSNVFFATLVLKEKANWRVLVSTALIVSGCILLVMFGNHESPEYTAHDLKEFYKSVPYIIYLITMAGVVVSMYAVYRHGKPHLDASARGEGSLFWQRILPVAYSLYAGMLGTQSVLFSKALSTLLKTTTNGENQLTSWFTYVTLVCFALTAVFWVTRLNKGLKLFNAIIIVPTLQISWTLFSIISGGIYYQEYKVFDSLGIAMFVLGVIIVISGVVLLTTARKDMEEVDEELEGSELKLFGEDGSDEEGRTPVQHHMDSAAPADQQYSFTSERPLVRGTDASPPGSTLSTAQSIESATPPNPLLHAGLRGSTQSVGHGPKAIAKALSARMSRASADLARRSSRAPSRTVSHAGSDMSLGREVAHDFSLEPGTAVKEFMGLGSQELPAVSVFGMPMVGAADFNHGVGAGMRRSRGDTPPRPDGHAHAHAHGAHAHAHGASANAHSAHSAAERGESGGALMLGQQMAHLPGSRRTESVDAADATALAAALGLQPGSPTHEGPLEVVFEGSSSQYQDGAHVGPGPGSGAGASPPGMHRQLSAGRQPSQQLTPGSAQSGRYSVFSNPLAEDQDADTAVTIGAATPPPEFATRSPDASWRAVDSGVNTESSSGAQAPFTGSPTYSPQQGAGPATTTGRLPPIAGRTTGALPPLTLPPGARGVGPGPGVALNPLGAQLSPPDSALQSALAAGPSLEGGDPQGLQSSGTED